jgi:hypothetical protein
MSVSWADWGIMFCQYIGRLHHNGVNHLPMFPLQLMKKLFFLFYVVLWRSLLSSFSLMHSSSAPNKKKFRSLNIALVPIIFSYTKHYIKFIIVDVKSEIQKNVLSLFSSHSPLPSAFGFVYFLFSSQQAQILKAHNHIMLLCWKEKKT